MSITRSLLVGTIACIVACSNDPGAPMYGSMEDQLATGGDQQPKFTEGKDYVVLERVRFMDNTGFQRPAEAFSVLLPKGWSHEGGIHWKGLNECRAEMVTSRWKAASADGAIRYQVLPNHSWASASDPMMLQMMQMQASQGGCEVGTPMDATAYLKQVMVARDLDGATVTEVKENVEVARELERKAMQNKAAFEQWGGQAQLSTGAVVARLKWADGTEGIAFCSIVNVVMATMDMYTGAMQQNSNSTAADRSVMRFPASRRDEAERVLASIQGSYTTNPQWADAVNGYLLQVRNMQDQQHHQRMAALEEAKAADRRGHQQRMNDIAASGAANTARHNERMGAMDQQMRTWEQEQSSQDRQHTQFIKTIREVETWNDGNNGRVEMASGYDHAWSRGDGTYVLTNSPNFDPGAVFQDQNWQPMSMEK